MSNQALPGVPRPRPESAGFTLVELMIAVFLMSVGILAVGRMFVISQHHSAQGRQETLAVSLAQEIREKILSKDFDEIESLFDGVDTGAPGTITLPCQTWAAHLAANLGATGRGRILVYSPAEDAEIVDGMLSVRIIVDWLESGAPKDVTMRFSLSRMGI
jgi:prepilin-type N-terminal cleavage/methylation domain-containing protein